MNRNELPMSATRGLPSARVARAWPRGPPSIVVSSSVVASRIAPTAETQDSWSWVERKNRRIGYARWLSRTSAAHFSQSSKTSSSSASLSKRSEEHTSELQSLRHLVCRLLLEKKKK